MVWGRIRVSRAARPPVGAGPPPGQPAPRSADRSAAAPHRPALSNAPKPARKAAIRQPRLAVPDRRAALPNRAANAVQPPRPEDRTRQLLSFAAGRPVDSPDAHRVHRIG